MTRLLAALPLLLVMGSPASPQDGSNWTVVETAHFRFHFQPQPRMEPSAFSAQEERAFGELQATFAAPLPGKINFYVWNSSEEGGRVLGRPSGFSVPELLLIHATVTQTPGHELAHVLVFHTVHPDTTNRFINEGVAVAFDLLPRDRVALARRLMRRNGVMSVSILDLWQDPARLPDDVMFPIAGAFVERLAAAGGKESLLRLLKTQTLSAAQTVYGPVLDRIVADLQAELSHDVSD